jgi:hypothetical protein
LVEVLPVPLSPKARRIIFEPGTVRSGDGYAELIDHAPGTVLNLENADAGQSDFVAVLEMASGHHPRHRQEFAETTERGTSLILGRLLLFRLASSRRLY